MINEIVSLRSKLQQISEDKGHLDHPEDLVFLQGTAGAKKALNAMLETAKNPTKITIKFDGYPALIFGRDIQGKFSIMDKHMFNKKDGTGRAVYSPGQFRQYDLSRGVDRSDLHRLINEIWTGLEKSTPAEGYYWGDLLFNKHLVSSDGKYTFKANPNGITYTVEVDSNIGKLITNKTAGIAVHQQLAPDAPSTDFAVSLHGSIGKLSNHSDVAIVPSAMPITPNIKIDVGQVARVKAAIVKYQDSIEQLMNSAPQARSAFNQLFTVYINKRIVSGDLTDLVDGFLVYFQARNMPDAMLFKLSDHLHVNKEGLIGAFTVWVELYKLKMNLVAQLNKAAESSPVKGFLEDGTETHEGFVSFGLKFVDRMGFSRQNLQGRQ